MNGGHLARFLPLVHKFLHSVRFLAVVRRGDLLNRVQLILPAEVLTSVGNGKPTFNRLGAVIAGKGKTSHAACNLRTCQIVLYGGVSERLFIYFYYAW